MSRAQRLLDLLQALRRHRRPVRGQDLASELAISLRTLYRDIASLQAQGAAIEGEAGLGYLLRPGFTLPPLMFTPEEIEALVLGSRWVAQHGDTHLAAAATDALAKIAAVMPADRRDDIETTPLLVGPTRLTQSADVALATIRKAIRTERKVTIAYLDRDNEPSLRTIWPFAIGYFQASQVIVAWCELRQSFRHFRPDRISELTLTDQRPPKRRAALLKEWRTTENIALTERPRPPNPATTKKPAVQKNPADRN
jgi:predicted DNA-binding transcriptional regulator YafY